MLDTFKKDFGYFRVKKTVLNDSENFVRGLRVWKMVLDIFEQNFSYILLWDTVKGRLKKDFGFFRLRKPVLI